MAGTAEQGAQKFALGLAFVDNQDSGHKQSIKVRPCRWGEDVFKAIIRQIVSTKSVLEKFYVTVNFRRILVAAAPRRCVLGRRRRIRAGLAAY
jgi:hypothetical protein